LTRLLVSLVILTSVVHSSYTQAQTRDEPVDSAAVAQILKEATEQSQIMEVLSYLTDVHGPRLTWSPAYKRSAWWVRGKLESWGLESAHLEGWAPTGRGWSLERYSAHVIGQQASPLLSYPKAWSPGTRGTVTGDVVLLQAKTDSALETFKGKLKGKFVLMGEARKVNLNFKEEARRYPDSYLLELANSEGPRRRQRRFQRTPDDDGRALREYRKWLMCQEEGALAVLSPGGFDGGSISVLSATVPTHPDTPRTRRARPWGNKVPKVPPQIAVAVEHYNRMVRMMEKGERLKMEMNLDVTFTKEDSGYNVLAEIPGTDLKDEVVMIGAHLDSWHGATGATDNGTGVAVCMEAMRILKKLDLKPRRTIRIALWGGEEQGTYGSRAYVTRHLGTRERVNESDSTQDEQPSSSQSQPGTGAPGGEWKITLTPQGEKFSVYFNDDNGTGKFRGIYMEGNDAVRPIFRRWFEDIGGKTGSFTLSLTNTGSTDHEPFKNIGLPGFQFIQDEIEYFSRTWHSTMDFYDRALEEDLKQSAAVMAVFAYNAAMRDEKIPRKR